MKLKYNRKNLRNYLIFTLGLYFLSLGVVLIVRSALGTTPISSPNYVLSLGTPLTLGTWTTLTNLLMMVAQWMLLRKDKPDLKKRRLEILLQLPFSMFFSAFIDFNMFATTSLLPVNYLSSLFLLLAGCFIQAVGVVLELKGNVVMMSAEGLVARIADRLDRPFSYVKIAVDVALVAIAVVLSYFWLGSIKGVREGSAIAAFLTGYIVKFLASKVMTQRTLNKIKRRFC